MQTARRLVKGPDTAKTSKKQFARLVTKNNLEVRDSTKIFKLLKTLASRNVPQRTEDLTYWMFLFLYEKWDSVPWFRDECFHYIHELYFEATADTFWGVGWILK